ncbi:unnamed protein product [Sphagnum jensenii]|uniref:Uncharacterized protein n=1 Tax=Sphagnum jensenii TaxID=128206 RepID=A0ABP0VWF2_9BRYO
MAMCLLAMPLFERWRSCDDDCSVFDAGNSSFANSVGIPSELLFSARYISQSKRLGVLPQPQSRTFTLEELKEAIHDLSPAALVGEGSHGKVRLLTRHLHGLCHQEEMFQQLDGVNLKKGPWTSAEDAILVSYVSKHGEGNWNSVQKHSGLFRCGKSCRLRWVNRLRPNLKKGAFSPDEERTILDLHSKFGNKLAWLPREDGEEGDDEDDDTKDEILIVPTEITNERDHATLCHILSTLPRPTRAGEVTLEAQSIEADQQADEVSKVIDRRDVPGRETPLHLAVRLSDSKTVEMLMSVGADWSLQNEQGSDQSFLFLGDGSEDGKLAPGTLCVLTHKDKEVSNALEGAGIQPSDAEIVQEVAAMSRTNMYRPG